MLLESQNELLAAEEALNINLPEVSKLANSSGDDDNIEIDEMVLELFSRLHEHDASESRDLSNTLEIPTIFQEHSLTDFNKMQFKPKMCNTSKTINNNYSCNNNNIITNAFTNCGASTVQTPDSNINDDDECAIEIISQEIIRQPNTFSTSNGNDNILTNTANDFVRIQLSFVDKSEQRSASATNGREVTAAPTKEKATAKTTMSTITTTTTMTTTTTTTTRVYICDVCHKNFPVAGRFLAHFRRVHLKSFYKKQAKCPYCPRYFTTIGKFKYSPFYICTKRAKWGER